MVEIQKIVDELSKIKEVQAIILFGSYARKEQKPYSDKDLCVVTKPISKPLKHEILSSASREIDLSLFSDLPLNVQYRILKEGKVLFERDELFIHRLQVRTILWYLDFKPTLTRHAKRVLEV